MLKKFLTCCALMLVMICAVSTTAFARPTELTMVEAFEQDSETLRVEISYRGDKLDASNVSTELKSGILRVDLDNTLPGRVSRISGTKINADVADFVEKIAAQLLKFTFARISAKTSMFRLSRLTVPRKNLHVSF